VTLSVHPSPTTMKDEYPERHSDAPKGERPTESTAPAAVAPSGPGGPPTDRKPRRAAVEPPPEPRPCGVLVVEADPDLQWRLARSLTVEGNRGVGTSSGDGALALIEQWRVDVVLIAEDLPGMDGLEVIRRILDVRPAVAIVLMTAEVGAEIQVEARLAGAQACVRKPVELDALRTIFAGIPLRASILPPVAAFLPATDDGDVSAAE